MSAEMSVRSMLFQGSASCSTHWILAVGGHTLIAWAGLRLALVAPLGAFRSRGRHVEPPPPLEATHPAAAAILRKMQRETRSRMLSAATGDAAVAVEDALEDNLLLHYVSPRGTITLAGGWLGSGRRRYVWVPLRPTLAWNGRTSDDAVTLLLPDETAKLALDLHHALTTLHQRHVIEEFFPPDPIPAEERQRVLDRYAALLASYGWTVIVHNESSQRSLKRTPEAVAAGEWSQADREELARLEALVAQMLKGSRAGSRILHQDK